jgi:hypothetical protein
MSKRRARSKVPDGIFVSPQLVARVRGMMKGLAGGIPPLEISDVVGMSVDQVLVKLAEAWLPRSAPANGEDIVRLIGQAVGLVILADVRLVRAGGFLATLSVPPDLAAHSAFEAYIHWHGSHATLVVEITNKVRRGESLTDREQLIRHLDHTMPDLFGDIDYSLAVVAETLDKTEGKLRATTGSADDQIQDRDARRRTAGARLLELAQGPDPAGLFFVGRDGKVRVGQSQLATRDGTRRPPAARKRSLEDPVPAKERRTEDRETTIGETLEAQKASSLVHDVQIIETLRLVGEVRVEMLAQETSSRARRVALEHIEGLLIGEVDAASLANEEGLDRSSITKAVAEVREAIREKVRARGLELPGELD